jgi:hypothetical protein
MRQEEMLAALADDEEAEDSWIERGGSDTVSTDGDSDDDGEEAAEDIESEGQEEASEEVGKHDEAEGREEVSEEAKLLAELKV